MKQWLAVKHWHIYDLIQFHVEGRIYMVLDTTISQDKHGYVVKTVTSSGSQFDLHTASLDESWWLVSRRQGSQPLDKD